MGELEEDLGQLVIVGVYAVPFTDPWEGHQPQFPLVVSAPILGCFQRKEDCLYDVTIAQQKEVSIRKHECVSVR